MVSIVTKYSYALLRNIGTKTYFQLVSTTDIVGK